ncbi:MAG: hypothetical protein ABI448_11210 [Bacteroidia bacterium]
MKKEFLKTALLGFMAAVLITSCESNEKKVEHAEENVQDAKTNLTVAAQELNQAREDSVNDYILFKKESEIKLKENDVKIADLKEKMKANKKAIQIKYQKKLDELNEKNIKLQEEIQQYKESDKSKWNTFKLEFNRKIDELGNSISTIAEDNTNDKP